MSCKWNEMTNLPNRDDREAKIYYCGPRAVENLLLLKKWFRWLSPQRAPQAKAQLVGVVVAAEISIIKIGLVYVIMIVITLWRHPAPSQSLQSLTAHIHTLHAHLLWRGFQKRLLCVYVCVCVQSCYFALPADVHA